MLRTVGPSRVGLAGRLCAEACGEHSMDWDTQLRGDGEPGSLRSLQKGLQGQCFLMRDIGGYSERPRPLSEAEGRFIRGFVGSFRSTAKSEGICIRPEVTSSACDRDQAAPGTSSRGSARATRARGRGAESPPPPKRGGCRSAPAGRCHMWEGEPSVTVS